MSEEGTNSIGPVAQVMRRQDREQQWRDRVAAWKASGLTQAAYCREQQWAPAELSWWKHELARREKTLKADSSPATSNSKPAKTKSAFIPVRISKASPASECFEVVLRSGQTIRMSAGFDEAGLRRLLCVLESSAC